MAALISILYVSYDVWYYKRWRVLPCLRKAVKGRAHMPVSARKEREEWIKNKL
jgi:hypothetical protein